MDTYGKIATKIREIASKGKSSSYIILPAEIVSVENTTCTVKIEDLQVSDVRLRAVINGKDEQILVTPKQGSYVLVADLSGGNLNDFAVISYSETESINIKIGSQTAVMDKNGVIFNGGNNGGLVLSEKLQSELDKVIHRVNDIATDLTAIAAAATATGQAPVLGATLGTMIKGNTGNILTPLVSPQKTIFENDKIKH